MILMISPGMFWLSAQQAPPRRKLCPDKLPSPWVTAFSFLSNDRGTGGEGWGLVVWPWFLFPGTGWSCTVNIQSALSTKESLVKCLFASNFCFANRLLALRNRPKNITKHAAQKTMSSLSLIFNFFLIPNNISGEIGLFRFTAVPFALSMPFKVEEMNQLSFNGLLKPASRCLTLTMFKYCRTDAGQSRLAK